MAFLAVREFKCTLCQQRFTLLSGDLLLPEPDLCDQCLREIWTLQGDELVDYVAERLGGEGRMSVSDVVQYIERVKGQWVSAEEAITEREQMRRMMG